MRGLHFFWAIGLFVTTQHATAVSLQPGDIVVALADNQPPGVPPVQTYTREVLVYSRQGQLKGVLLTSQTTTFNNLAVDARGVLRVGTGDVITTFDQNGNATGTFGPLSNVGSYALDRAS